MESQLRKGLYFTGEVLDIVGKRGGYNFHFAWASGMIAGREMRKS
jgi:predicted flavoprotein YhiN